MAFRSIRQAYCPPLLVCSTNLYKPLFKTICLIGWRGEMPLLPKSSCGPKVSKRSIFADLLNNIHFLGLRANQEVLISGGRSARGKIMCFSFGQILDKFLILFSVRSLTRPVFGHLLDYIAHTKKQHNMATEQPLNWPVFNTEMGFHIKALAFACPRTRSLGSCVFDSTHIVPNGATALWAFAHQMTHHGFSLHSILSFLILRFFPS